MRQDLAFLPRPCHLPAQATGMAGFLKTAATLYLYLYLLTDIVDEDAIAPHETAKVAVSTEAPPLDKEVRAAETTAKSLEAAEAVGAAVTPEVTAAAGSAQETAHALLGAHGLSAILDYAPAALEMDSAVTPQPAVAGSAGAASSAVAREGAGKVRDNVGQLTGVRGYIECCLLLCGRHWS